MIITEHHVYLDLMAVAVTGALAAYLRAPKFGVLRASIAVPVMCISAAAIYAGWWRLSDPSGEWTSFEVAFGIALGVYGAVASFASGLLAAGLRLRYQRRP